jgi:hypothetical protein
MIALLLSAALSLDSTWQEARTALLQAPPIQQSGPIFKEPVLQDARPSRIFIEKAGKEAGRVSLPAQLDRHRDALTRQLGAAARLISAAGDAGFKNYFLTFIWSDALAIAPLGELGRLRGEGVNARVDAATVYNFKVSINIFNPVRGSTLKMTAVQGTKGPNHEVKTGVILDAVKARSYVFKAKGTEYWLLHGTDVDPATNRPAATRSLLFINEAGTSSKAWPLAESDLPADVDVAVTLKDRLILRRSADGTLTIKETN